LAEHFIHIPTPGDHYSPGTGSSVITVIYELTRQHHAAEGLAGFLRNPAMREGYGRRARARAEQLTWEHSYQKLREAVGGSG
jgi:hypothetical protein